MTRGHAAGIRVARDSMTRTPNKFPSPTRGPAADPRQGTRPSCSSGCCAGGPTGFTSLSECLCGDTLSLSRHTGRAGRGCSHGGTVTGTPDQDLT